MQIDPNTLKQYAQTLLTLQEHLPPFIFSPKGKMHDDVRKKITLLANHLFNNVLANYKNIYIKDIILCGSLASYMWNENSDIDIKIITSCNWNKFFLKDIDCAWTFAIRANNAWRAKTNMPKINEKNVDINFSFAIQNNTPGIYSVLKNKWIITPSPYQTQDIDIEKLCDATMQRIDTIQNKIDTLCTGSIQNLEQIQDLYYKIVNDQFSSFFEFLIFKLLKKFYNPKNILSFYKQATTSRLSIQSKISST